MNIRIIQTTGLTGACLINVIIGGCDQTSSKPTSSASQAVALSPPTATEHSPPVVPAKSSTIEKTSEASSTTSTSRPTIVESSSSPTSRGAAADDLPPIPEVNVDALPDRIRRKIKIARNTLEAAPSNSGAACELGALYFTHNLFEPAIACFRRAMVLIPKSPAPRYFLAVTLAQAGDDAGAVREFILVAQADPTYAPARIRHADLMYKTNKSVAAELYRQASEILPDAPYPQYRLGRCLLACGKPEAAKQAFLKAVELQPDYGDAQGALTELYTSENRSADAARHQKLAAEGKPARGFADPLYAGLLEAGNRAVFASNRAMSLAAAGHIDDAIELLKNAIAAEPAEMQYIAALANIREAIGDIDETAKLWEQIYGIDSKWPRAASRLANLYQKTDRLPKAIGILTSHLRRDPDDADARHGLALLLARNREPDAAVAEVDKFLKMRGETAESLCQAAHALIECERFEEAARRLDQAAALDPLLADVHFFRGMMHAKADDVEKAFAEFDKTIEKNPDGLDGYMEAAKYAGERRDWATQHRFLQAGYKKKSNVPSLVAMLAHLLATCPDASVRNGQEAVKLAEHICLSTGRKSHAYLDILGEAHAEAGDFEKASWATRQAIALAKQNGKSETVKRYQVRLDLYDARKPYRMK